MAKLQTALLYNDGRGHEQLHFLATFRFQHFPFAAFFSHFVPHLSTQLRGGGAMTPGGVRGACGTGGGGELAGCVDSQNAYDR
mmetsp:Transcript_30818/g.76944  ORF Transcript_30818/g.76944 Transcript_30818/m.76944 type:complete len:83 (-) Transcript_30818:347-595(-)